MLIQIIFNLDMCGVMFLLANLACVESGPSCQSAPHALEDPSEGPAVGPLVLQERGERRDEI